MHIATGSETTCQILTWKADAFQVIRGLNITAISNQVPMVEIIIQGTLAILFLEKLHILAEVVYKQMLENMTNNAACLIIEQNGINYYHYIDYMTGALSHIVKIFFL